LLSVTFHTFSDVDDNVCLSIVWKCVALFSCVGQFPTMSHNMTIYVMCFAPNGFVV